MLVTELGIVISFRDLQFMNALSPMLVTELGMVNSYIGIVNSNGFLNDTNPIWDQQTMLAGSPGGRMDVQIVFRTKNEKHWIAKKPLQIQCFSASMRGFEPPNPSLRRGVH